MNYVFVNNKVFEHINFPGADTYARRSYLFSPRGKWFRCGANSPAPKTSVWWPKQEWEIPKILRTKALLLS